MDIPGAAWARRTCGCDDEECSGDTAQLHARVVANADFYGVTSLRPAHLSKVLAASRARDVDVGTRARALATVLPDDLAPAAHQLVENADLNIPLDTLLASLALDDAPVDRQRELILGVDALACRCCGAALPPRSLVAQVDPLKGDGAKRGSPFDDSDELAGGVRGADVLDPLGPATAQRRYRRCPACQALNFYSHTEYRLSLTSSSIIVRLSEPQENLLLSSRPYSFPGGPRLG